MLRGTAEFLDSFAESAVWEYAPTGNTPKWRRVEGKGARRAAFHRAYDQTTDTTRKVHDVVAEAGSVAVAYEFSVTFATDRPGLPAGAQALYECVNLFKVRDGPIVSEKQYTGPMLLGTGTEPASAGTTPKAGDKREKQEGPTMTDSSTKEVVMNVFAAWDSSAEEGPQSSLAFYADDCVWEFSPTTATPRWSRVEGRAAMSELRRQIYRNRRGLPTEISHVLVEGDSVVVAYTARSATTFDIPGFPAGSRRRTEIVNIYTVRDGLIVAERQHTGHTLLEREEQP